MEDMVDAVDHHRRLLPAEIENAFDPQQVLAAHVAKIREPVRNGHPVERFVEREHEAGDRCIVAVMGMTVVLVHRLVGYCERRLVEPARNVDRFFSGSTSPAPNRSAGSISPCITLSILAPG